MNRINDSGTSGKCKTRILSGISGVRSITGCFRDRVEWYGRCGIWDGRGGRRRVGGKELTIVIIMSNQVQRNVCSTIQFTDSKTRTSGELNLSE